MRTAPSTWLNYKDCLRNKMYEPEELVVEGVQPLLNFKQVPVFSHSLPTFYMLDYTTGHYMTMSDTVKELLGFTTNDFMKEGMALLAENYDKTELKILNEKMFPGRLALLSDTPADQHKNYVFTHNFRMRDARKRMVHLIQRSSFVKSDEEGRPLVGLGMVVNVEHFHHSRDVTQIIERIYPDAPDRQPETISKTVFFANEEDKLLTKREIEVLRWMSEGLSIKQIADRLFVSEHTVINHRRNMNHKTNTNNALSLVSFAIKNGII